VSQPVGEIKVRRGLETYGGKGESLVKGVVVNLSAIALSVKPGGSIELVQILGGLVTHGPGVEALELHGRIGEQPHVFRLGSVTPDRAHTAHCRYTLKCGRAESLDDPVLMRPGPR